MTFEERVNAILEQGHWALFKPGARNSFMVRPQDYARYEQMSSKGLPRRRKRKFRHLIEQVWNEDFTGTGAIADFPNALFYSTRLGMPDRGGHGTVNSLPWRINRPRQRKSRRTIAKNFISKGSILGRRKGLG
jgi:hypothetical protein